MTKTKVKVSNEVIEAFLQGSNPQKYIVAIEAEYSTPTVTLVINDPEKGKALQKDTYQPFLWCKEDITKIIYEGKRTKIIEMCGKYGIKFKALRTWADDGTSPERLLNGYKFLVTCKKSYNDLINFFREGGVDVFNKEFSRSFVMFSPTEQYLIQTGKRLFKGMDDYDDLHRFQFDLETEGLFANKHAIFQIGVRDNRGMEYVLETIGKTPAEKRNAERENIEKFFKIIDIIQPDMITGYNSENFDWPFIFERAEQLKMDVSELAITLNRISKIKRKASTLKLGGETEAYNQTYMWGYNIVDISHAVRRAMAINSEIKSWGLKYITQYSEIAKPNRVYVPGDKINATWSDKSDFAFDDTNGDWYKITEKSPLKDGYKIVTGAYIVQRYLQDDLWETEQVDNLFNQASFLISKMLPTTFMRSSTMGTAGQWKLIMAAWSYENGLAIPETQQKRDFTGGLSRLLEVGYARNVVKLDFAALYPKTQLTHGIFPELDITGVMEGMLTYVVDTRDKFKDLTGKEKKIYKALEAQIKGDHKKMSPEEIEAIKAKVAAMDPKELEEIKNKIAHHKSLSNLYDKKQLPLKILANSWFGSYGAPYIFNWGDTDSAEETTCRGRQYLRLMVKHFTEKYGFRALVGDTDGFNFSFPDNIKDIKYTAKGNHWKTVNDAGKELSGLDAVLADFNENYMEGRMGLDIDDICSSTINFARKNYANDIDGKIKLVGNSVKSKKMSVYIEEFLGKGIRMLLDGDGHSFINFYYDYVDKIYNFQIPLVKIATKAKVKTTISEYKKKALLKNKKGNPLPKQAHMELAIKEGLDVNLGDMLFYVNIGSAKSHGDIKSEKNKATGVVTTNINCKMIQPEVVERDFELIKELEVLKKSIIKLKEELIIDDEAIAAMESRIDAINAELITDEYNVARYLDAFNKKVKPLLVCFHPDIRKDILLDIVKVKDETSKKKVERLKERIIFTKGQCELVSGMPFKETDQDSYEELMTMEDKEIKFWDRVNKVPNNMTEEDWNRIRVDYHERMRIAKINGIEHEKNKIDSLFSCLEIDELNKIANIFRNSDDMFKSFVDENIEGMIQLFMIVGLGENGTLISRTWGVEVGNIMDVFKYKKEAIDRDVFYKANGLEHKITVVKSGRKNIKVDRYSKWIDYVNERKLLTGETITTNVEVIAAEITPELNITNIDIKTPVINLPKEEVKKKVKLSDGEDDDEDTEDEDSAESETQAIEAMRAEDEDLKLDDEVDDTFGEIPDGYIISSPVATEEKKSDNDGWLF